VDNLPNNCEGFNEFLCLLKFRHEDVDNGEKARKEMPMKEKPWMKAHNAHLRTVQKEEEEEPVIATPIRIEDTDTSRDKKKKKDKEKKKNREADEPPPPPTQSMSISKTDRASMVDAGEVDSSQLIPWLGSCCFICSFFCKWPTCVGAVSNQTCCCFANNIMLCKQNALNKDSYMICCRIDCEMIRPRVCVLSRTQLCCLDTRISCPPTESVPCMINVCFWTCVYKNLMFCRCCSKLNTLEKAYNDKEGK